MATIPQLISAAMADKSAADKRATDAEKARTEYLRSIGNIRSDEMSPDQHAEFARLNAEFKDASKQVTASDAKLSQLREIEREETQVIKDSSTRNPDYHVDPPTGKRNSSTEGHRWLREDGRPADIATGERYSDHPVIRQATEQARERDQYAIATYGDLGQLVRSLSTTGASAVVPQVWSNQVIDLMRNKSAILSANPTYVVMDRKVVNVGRLTGDPTAAFRAEGDTITASDPSFDSVTLTARTVSALVVGSLEFFQDSINGEQLISQALANALALELDKNALFGGMVTGANDEGFNLASPPAPKGLMKNLLDNASGQVLGYATNGTAITAATPYNEILDTLYQPRLYNFQPNALIWNTKMAKKLAKTYDTTYQQLVLPREMQTVQVIESNQIPSYTRGTMSNTATDIVVGQFSEMLVGQRYDLSVRVLDQRYAETGSVGVVAVMRVDVQVAHPNAFSIYRALGGA